MTGQQLNELGFNSDSIGRIYYSNDFEYEFNVITNELIFYNDGFPDTEPLVRIKNYEHLKQVINALTNYIK